ncbi:MAG: OmpA family protein [Xanthomonadales bacterium]|nr:OmpA family protein [Xanthomonadales bacterium]
MKIIKLLLVVSVMTTSFTLLAKEDAKGSRDHPLISRYPDFYIKQYAQAEFDEAKLIVAKFDEKAKQAETITVTGRVTNIRYAARQKDAKVSVLQLYRNYENALKKLGAEFIFTCRNESCFEPYRSGTGVLVSNWVNGRNNLYKGIFSTIHGDFGILTASLSPSANEKAYIMIAVSADHINGYRSIQMSIVEAESLDIEKIAIGSPDDLHKAITAQGKVVLEGVYFEHNKASIKAESADTLEIIAAYLEANPNSRFYVVGHTDSSGSYEYNLKLSSNRAQAVLDKLIQSHNISPTKLKAVGVGSVSPAASNVDEDGQASNRRVELVLMGAEP